MKSSKKKSGSKQNLFLGIAAIAILAGIAWVSLRPTNDTSHESVATLAADVLSPAMFTDTKARAAYQVAKDIPEILEQLPCFCGCKKHFGHQNNLFCFKDQHGAGCEICEDIALDARQMHDKGMPVSQIRENIVAKYSRYDPDK